MKTIDTEQFRRELAGLVDPKTGPGAVSKDELRAEAVEFCVILAQLFNRDTLDPITLWDRIGSGLAVAAAKTDDGDLDSFAQICLEHVKADCTRVATNPRFGEWFINSSRDSEWRRALVSHFSRYGYVLISLARAKWKAERDAKEAADV